MNNNVDNLNNNNYGICKGCEFVNIIRKLTKLEHSFGRSLCKYCMYFEDSDIEE